MDENKKSSARTTTKFIVWFCLINGCLWVWCSYVLAWFGRTDIAEGLSKVAITDIVAVVLIYCLKSLFENISKNNVWPDKPDKDKKIDSN